MDLPYSVELRERVLLAHEHHGWQPRPFAASKTIRQ